MKTTKPWVIVLLVIIIIACVAFLIRYFTAPKVPTQKVRPGESFRQLLEEPKTPQSSPQSAPQTPSSGY